MRFRRIYLWLGLTLGPLAIAGLRLYTKVTKSPRVRVIVVNESGKILLVKNVLSLRNEWTLPGGGVARGESYAETAQRELREETGILASLDSFELIATLEPANSGLQYVAPILKTECRSLSLPATLYNTREIADAGWFDPEKLPEDTAVLVQKALLVAESSLR
jgi:ADP-ribose pyrophosphatase YjhB (NUDIX family)